MSVYLFFSSPTLFLVCSSLFTQASFWRGSFSHIQIFWSVELCRTGCKAPPEENCKFWYWALWLKLDFNTVSRSDFSGSLANSRLTKTYRSCRGRIVKNIGTERHIVTKCRVIQSWHSCQATGCVVSKSAPSRAPIVKLLWFHNVGQYCMLNSLSLSERTSLWKCWICFNLNANVLTFLTQLDESNLVQHTQMLCLALPFHKQFHSSGCRFRSLNPACRNKDFFFPLDFSLNTDVKVERFNKGYKRCYRALMMSFGAIWSLCSHVRVEEPLHRVPAETLNLV